MTQTPPTERPLVTFALFAYNQEDYIREAIEGAFAQTYEPLEIILSDDCSSDRTFEIMQEMAAAYEGPHEVLLNRNESNLGTASHVQTVFELSSGILFVVAAGDDISIQERTEVLVDTWISAGKPEGALHSGSKIFRGNQILRSQDAKATRFPHDPLDGMTHGWWLPAAAPTCAYTRSIFDRFRPLIGGSIIEDLPLFFRVALTGKFTHTNRPLVHCRRHDKNAGTGYTIDSPERWNRFMHSKIIAFLTIRRDLTEWSGEIDSRVSKRIERRILNTLISAPPLFLPETQSINRLERALLAFRMIKAEAVSRTLRERIIFSLDFFGYRAHRKIGGVLRSSIECIRHRIRRQSLTRSSTPERPER